MIEKKLLTAVLMASLLLGVSSQAIGVPLTSLVGGDSLAAGDVLFDDFSYTDEGGPFGDVAVSSDDIDVTGSSTATSASLLFSFDPLLQLAAEEAFEINGGFSAGIAGGLLELTGVTLELAGSAGGGSFDFIELGSNTLGASATIDAGTPGPVSFGTSLAGLTAYNLLWDLQGEIDIDSSATVNSFEVTFDLRSLPPAAVPEPAALPLILSGLIALALHRKRRNSA
ncbi:MAG: VPLPA-CTERM sorting domain-containing protein [Thiohalocapsa sp.]